MDSRTVEEGIRRRRECLRCGRRFTTYERVLSTSLMVIKKDGRREAFQRDKLLSGIRKACEKRPLPTGAIEGVVDDIEGELHRMGKSEVPSSVVGELVMERLRALDHIAYIRFASVYRQFGDLEDVRREVESLSGNGKPAHAKAQLSLLPEGDLLRAEPLLSMGGRRRRVSRNPKG